VHRLVLIVFSLVLLAGAVCPAAALQYGGGLHYLRTLGDIKDTPDFDENSVGFLASLLFAGPLLRVEGMAEFIPNYGGSSSTMIAPQGWLMLGGFIYGGAGIGIGYIDDDWQDNPFYALRAGVNLGLAGLALDVFTSYQFQSTSDLEGLGKKDLDALTFGALIRFGG